MIFLRIREKLKCEMLKWRHTFFHVSRQTFRRLKKNVKAFKIKCRKA